MHLVVIYVFVWLQVVLQVDGFVGWCRQLKFAPTILHRQPVVLQMSIKDQLVGDMKNAMKAKEKIKLSAIRSIQSAITQKEVDERIEVTDAIAIEIMSKLIKQRKESIKSYEDGGRLDLADNERVECEVIASYMPQPLSKEEIDLAISNAVAHVGAVTVKDMGKVMAELKPILSGKADMSAVGGLLRERLGGIDIKK